MVMKMVSQPQDQIDKPETTPAYRYIWDWVSRWIYLTLGQLVDIPEATLA
jgi:hypothetical protein